MTAASILPLELQGVSLERDRQRLLKAVSVRIAEGPKTIVLGPNGAGKSLLLRLCHGLIAPSEGSGVVAWRGGPRSAALPGDGDAAPGHAAPLGRRQYRLRARPAPCPPAGAPAAGRAEALERTGLGAFARVPARVLSFGEQQRLALARSWALKPQVLFLDEPTANLDPAATHVIEDAIVAMAQEGTKIIMTTHDLGQARRLADEVMFLHRGRLLEHARGYLRSLPGRRTSSPAPSCGASCSGGSAASSPRPRPARRAFPFCTETLSLFCRSRQPACGRRRRASTRAERTMRARRIRGGPRSRPVARPSLTDALVSHARAPGVRSLPPSQRARARGIVAGLAAAALAVVLAMPGARAGDFITVASTTSTQNAGLFDRLLPLFEAETGIEVRVVAVGTGQALRLARNGDADLLLVHDKPSEEAFVAEGYGSARFDLMYNDFVVVGPASDPAGIAGADEAAAALAKIAAAEAPFVSRGDDSGTHRRERALWAAAGMDPMGASGTWYREAGQGMGATLNTASMMEAYTLADRGTWLKMRGRLDLRLLVEGDAGLRNQYGVTLVSAERHPHVKAEAARRFAEWLISPAGQAAIDGFTIDGERLFIPNAN